MKTPKKIIDVKFLVQKEWSYEITFFFNKCKRELAKDLELFLYPCKSDALCPSVPNSLMFPNVSLQQRITTYSGNQPAENLSARKVV